MEDYGLLVLNGRSSSDSHVTYTHLSKIGNSVIDMVWSNQDALTVFMDSKVCNVATKSDHLPVIIKLKISNSNSVCKQSKIKWKNLAAEAFFHDMNSQVNVMCKNDSIDTLINNFTETVRNVAYNVGMINYCKNNKKIKSLENKEWFDIECSKFKNEVKSKYKVCKKSGFEQKSLQDYLNFKKIYVKTCNEKKKCIERKLLKNLLDLEIQKHFGE